MKKKPLVLDAGKPSQLQTADWIGPKNNSALVAPAASNDDSEGYEVQSRWTDTALSKEYVCVDATTGAAVWVETTGGGGGDPYASQAEAEAGTVTNRTMNPLRTAQAIAALAGGGGGVERQFIYRPSEVTPADNVYNDLSLLLTDAQAVNGKKLILVDILANQAVPAGTYNFANCTLIYMNEISKVVQHELQFAASTFFSQLPDAIGVALKFANTGLFYVHTTSQTETNLHIIDHGKIDKTAGASFIRANTAGHIVNIFLTGTNATIANTEGITGTIRIQSGSTGNLFVTSLNTDVETRNNIFGANGTVNIYQLNGKQRTGSDTALTTPPTIIVSEFASRFTKLVDAPTSYTGQSLKALRVNAGETGIEFYTPSAGGSPERVAIFAPDEVAPAGNVYNDLALALTALQAENGVKKLIVRKPGFSQPIAISAATYSFAGIEIEAEIESTTIAPIFDFADGSEITTLPLKMSAVWFRNFNQTDPLVAVSGLAFVQLDSSSFQNDTTATQPFIRVASGGNLNVYVSGTFGGGFLNNSGSASVIDVTNGATVEINEITRTSFQAVSDIFSDDGTGGTINLYLKMVENGYTVTHSGIVAAILTIYNTEETRAIQLVKKAAQSVFYYDTVATPSGNVFNDLSLLLSAAASAPGKKIIYIVNASGLVPSGTYNFAGCELYNFNEDVNAIQPLVFDDNVTIVNFPEIFTAKLHFNNTVNPVCATGPGYFEIHRDGVLQNLGSQHIIALSGVQVARFAMRDRSAILYSSTGNVFYQTDTSQLFLTIADYASVGTGSLGSDGNETEFLTVYDYTLKPGGVPSLAAGEQIYAVTKYPETRVGEIITARNLAAPINSPPRVLNTAYINGNKPRAVSVVVQLPFSAAAESAQANLNFAGTLLQVVRAPRVTLAGFNSNSNPTNPHYSMFGIVPPGSNYQVTDVGSTGGLVPIILSWYEQDLSL